MTVIAWDGVYLAADTQITVDGAIYHVANKIRRLDDGRLVGAAGDAALCERWMDWLIKHKSSAAPLAFQCTDDAITGLEIKINGDVWMHDRNGAFCMGDTQVAIGSGAEPARAAMLMNASACDAVMLACQMNSSCGIKHGGVPTIFALSRNAN